MFVKRVSVTEKTDKLPVKTFNISDFKLKNYRGEVLFETESLTPDNTEVTLDSQTYCGIAETTGSVTVPEDVDGGLLQIIVGQKKGVTWSLSIPASPGEHEMDCVFGLPPTTAAMFSNLLPIPVKSVCKADVEAPDVQ